MKKLFQLSFVPSSADGALLIIRLVFGGMMMVHGWQKLTQFQQILGMWKMDFLGLPPNVSLSLAIFGELVCPALVVLGLFTRFAALIAGFTMGVAFFMAHQGKLTGENNGEMAFLYLGVYLALLISGAGRFSIDRKLGA